MKTWGWEEDYHALIAHQNFHPTTKSMFLFCKPQKQKRDNLIVFHDHVPLFFFLHLFVGLMLLLCLSRR